MVKVIVNADDFGLSKGVNHGIVDAHKYGIVTSTTMLVNMADVEHAVDLAKETPSLRVGIHLTLTCGKPVCNHVPSLTNEEGFFRLTSHYATKDFDIDLNDVEKEWSAQIERFLSFGLKPTHMDSHHHIHSWEPLLPVVKKLSTKYNLPVRNVFSQEVDHIRLFTDQLLTSFYGDQVSHDYFKQLSIEEGRQINSIEIMCHPAYLDLSLMKQSSYKHERLKELEVLTTASLPPGFVLA